MCMWLVDPINFIQPRYCAERLCSEDQAHQGAVGEPHTRDSWPLVYGGGYAEVGKVFQHFGENYHQVLQEVPRVPLQASQHPINQFDQWCCFRRPNNSQTKRLIPFIDAPHMFGRPWQYDENKQEYYVIYEDNAASKKEDALRQVDETDLGDFWLRHIEPICACTPRSSKWISPEITGSCWSIELLTSNIGFCINNFWQITSLLKNIWCFSSMMNDLFPSNPTVQPTLSFNCHIQGEEIEESSWRTARWTREDPKCRSCPRSGGLQGVGFCLNQHV